MKKLAGLQAVCLLVLIGSQILTLAQTFTVGSIVEVYNSGIGLKVRNAPCGDRIGNKPDGSIGVILEGPIYCVLEGTGYYWWRIRWSDGLEGWSAQDWLKIVEQPPPPPSEQPYISGVSPAQPSAQPSRQWLTVLGSGFVPDSQVILSIGGSSYPIPPDRTRFVSPSRIDVYVGLTEPGTWTIEVVNPGGRYSNTFSFQVISTVTQRWADPPTLASPPKEATVSFTPTFEWYSVPNADYYGLYISEPPYGPSHLVYENEMVYGASFTLPSGILREGVRYCWNMASHSAAGWSYDRTDGGRRFSDLWCFTIQPQDRQLPDLVVDNIVTVPYPPAASDYSTIRITIRNQGHGDVTATFFLHFYFDDNYFGRVSIDGLAAGATYTAEWRAVLWPSDTNPHILRVVVDPDNHVAEMEEDNNELSMTFRGTEPPRQTGTLYLETIPGEAAVYVDGQYKGTTPSTGYLEIKDLMAGDHTLEVRKPGYKQWIETVTVPPGKATYKAVFLELEQDIIGTIQIQATLNGQPWSGLVNYQLTGPQTIDGMTVPATFSNRPTGSYTLSYQSGGPSGATLTSITPSATQTLNSGGTITFTLNFTTSQQNPVLEVTPAFRDFGSVTVGQCSDQSFTVRNIGGGTLNGNASTSAPFSIVSGGSFNNLGAGQSSQVVVRFCPAVVGQANEVVSFSSSGGNISRSVSGIGVRVEDGQDPIASLPFAWPLRSDDRERLGQDYAQYNGYPKRPNHYHTGLDIGGSAGTEVFAVAVGTVVAVCPDGVQGGCVFNGQRFSRNSTNHDMDGVVILRHVLGDGRVIYSLYAHLGSVGQFRPDQVVGPETRLGTIKSDHLHFEIKERPLLHNPEEKEGSCIDPRSGQRSAQCWGYVLSHPKEYGYHDPILYFHDVTKFDSPRRVHVTQDDVLLRVGPGGSGGSEYRHFNRVQAGQEYEALARSVGTSTPHCPEGWYQILRVDGTRFDDTSPGRQGSSIPDGWVCARFISDTSLPPQNPVLEVAPPSLNFGDVRVGQCSDQSFAVRNRGGGTLSGTATTSLPFSIISGGSFSLGAAESTQVVVKFCPTAAGQANGTVSFTSNGGGLSLSVTGIGVTTSSTQHPRVVRFVYLIPSDRKLNINYQIAIEKAAKHVQMWYLNQMNGKSFQLHTPVVETFNTPHPSSWYSTHPTGSDQSMWFWDNVFEGGFQLTGGRFDDPNNIWIFYIDADPACKQIGGAGRRGAALLPANDLRGLVEEQNVPACPDESPDDAGYWRWVGGLAHELGHALGLGHPQECEEGKPSCPEKALMWMGYRSYPDAYLLPQDKDILNSNPFIITMDLSTSFLTLAVNKAGTGNGTVLGPGIDCGSDCQETYSSGTSVTLTATPAQGSTFAGWSGCDSTSGNQCTITMDKNKTVVAIFNSSQMPQLTCWSGSPLSKEELASLVIQYFPDGVVPQTGESIRVTAYAIAMAESKGNPTACGTKGEVGLWQITMLAFADLVKRNFYPPDYKFVYLFDPNENAKAAQELSNGGTDWNRWCTWEKTACGNQGDLRYKDYLDEARKVLGKVIPPPTRDSDRDGIPDSQDQCPYDSGPAYNNGCPVRPPLEGKSIEEALDLNRNYFIDDDEILQALKYWFKGEPVPDTNGKVIDDHMLRQLVEIWLSRRPITPSSRASFSKETTLNIKRITLSPNPVRRSQVRLKVDGTGIRGIKVQIFDLAGHPVYESDFTSGNVFELRIQTKEGQPLANGVYLYVVRVRGFDGREYVSEVRKLVVLR